MKIVRVYRQDRLDADLSAPVEGPGGALFLEGFAARPGIYLYRNEDGSIRRELVPRSRLWDERSIVSLGRAPLTLEHPPVFVTDENVQQFGVGDVGDEVIEGPGGFVRVRMAVRTRAAKDAIASGKVQLSPGYIAEIDGTPGVDPEFGEYDAVQVSREYNHLAIVDQARGGEDCRVRVDSLDWTISEADMKKKVDAAHTEPPMKDAEMAAEGEMQAEEPMKDAEMAAEGEMAAEEPMKDAEMAAEGEMPDDPSMEEEPSMEAPGWFMSWAKEFSAAMPDMIKAAMDGYMAKDAKPEGEMAAEAKMDGVDTDRIAWYNERKSLAVRADAQGVRYNESESNEKIANAILTSFGIKTDNLDGRSVVSMAIQMPSTVVKKTDSDSGVGQIVPPTSYGPKRV
jgi:hypothetical protein